MKKITIKNLLGDVIGVNEIESSKVDEFLNNIKINSPYGKSEYQREVSPREELEDGTIIEAVYETIPAEYTVEIEDITQEIEEKKSKEEKRKKDRRDRFDQLKKLDWSKIDTIAELKAVVKALTEEALKDENEIL